MSIFALIHSTHDLHRLKKINIPANIEKKEMIKMKNVEIALLRVDKAV